MPSLFTALLLLGATVAPSLGRITKLFADCNIDADCSDGKRCDHGICLCVESSSCATEEDCCDSMTCLEGSCRSQCVAYGSPCERSEDCCQDDAADKPIPVQCTEVAWREGDRAVRNKVCRWNGLDRRAWHLNGGNDNSDCGALRYIPRCGTWCGSYTHWRKYDPAAQLTSTKAEEKYHDMRICSQSFIRLINNERDCPHFPPPPPPPVSPGDTPEKDMPTGPFPDPHPELLRCEWGVDNDGMEHCRPADANEPLNIINPCGN